MYQKGNEELYLKKSILNLITKANTIMNSFLIELKVI